MHPILYSDTEYRTKKEDIDVYKRQALVPLRDYPSGSVPSKEPCRVLPHRGGQGQAGWEKEGGKGCGTGTDGG